MMVLFESVDAPRTRMRDEVRLMICVYLLSP